MTRRSVNGVLAVLLSASCTAGAAQTQQRPAAVYPERPVRFLVPFAAGGTADILARVLAENFTQILGQQFVVDNRAGSGGVVGTEIAANSPKDGYTLFVGNISTIGVNPALYRKLPYDPKRDFTPVSRFASAPFVLVVPAGLGASNVKDLIALAKSRPGKLNYASTGIGSPGHLAGALLATSANGSMEHVPYKGVGPALTDLASGEVQLLFLGIGPTQAQVKTGRIRALALSSAQRSRLMPDLPTVAESGVAGFDVTGWYGLFVPAGTPVAIVERLNQAVQQTAASVPIQKRFASLGADITSQRPAEFSVFVAAEMRKWAKVVKQSGIQPE
jgi:tripartite-type tricarboxylate transporter receptor subunit TctC